MSRVLTIENETHWKSSDILRIVRAAIAAAGADPKKKRLISVTWEDSNKAVMSGAIVDASSHIRIGLPKRGPKSPHANPMIVLAASAIPVDTTMLAVSESYRIANYLAFAMAYETDIDDRLYRQLKDSYMSTNPPSWSNANKLIITKYKDPKKDGTYLSFVARKKKAIARAEADIEREHKAVKAAERRLKSAKARKKKAEKALRVAAERRS
jgi:hypothetical protein